MSFYTLLPKGIKKGERRPAFLALHGHGSGGKESIAGDTKNWRVKRAIKHYNYDYGKKIVEEGYIVFCPDARGFGDRREQRWSSKSNHLSGSCSTLSNLSNPLGQTIIGLWVFDLMRLIDYVVTLDYVDASRIGCGGLSGGGSQTLWLSALDKRINCSIISGYYYDFKDSLLYNPDHCACNYVPKLWIYANCCDIGSLIAPRPLLIESGRYDPINGIKNGIDGVIQQAEVTRSTYELLSEKDNFKHYIFDGGHRWDGSETIPFINKHLNKNWD